MRIISPEKEIYRFKGTGLNGLCLKESFAFDREQGFRGREGINLLVHACHSMLSIFFRYFYFFFFFSQCLLLSCDSLLKVTITVIILPLLCTTRVLYIIPAVTDFYYFSP